MSPSLSERDLSSVWHPYSQRGLEQAPLVIAESEGVYLTAADGRRYLDGISSWWVALHGHRHPRISEAVRQQLEKAHHVVFAGCTHEPAITLAEKVLAVLPEKQSKVFFTDNGSSAVEASLKMALQYWQNKGKPEKKRFLSLENGYHGDTLGAMSVGGKTFFNRPFHELLFSTSQLPTPYSSADKSCDMLVKEIEKGNVAAFIYEPLLQGASGMQIYSPENLSRMLHICKENDVLCIADEVFTGFFKTGTCFASDQVKEQPDIVILSKALTGGSLPLAVLTATEEIHSEFVAETREKMFLHGHTFTANPLACVAAAASLDLMAEETFRYNLTRIIENQNVFASRVAQHEAVEVVRSIGMLVAFDLHIEGQGGYSQGIRDQIFTYCLEQGLFLRPLGNTIYLLPPVIMTDEQCKEMYSILEQFLDSYAAQTL
jgi:adenosylmethionine-8-amino-7-oxononanoate aminotransferase